MFAPPPISPPAAAGPAAFAELRSAGASAAYSEPLVRFAPSAPDPFQVPFGGADPVGGNPLGGAEPFGGDPPDGAEPSGPPEPF